jgi:hypothetical protein
VAVEKAIPWSGATGCRLLNESPRKMPSQWGHSCTGSNRVPAQRSLRAPGRTCPMGSSFGLRAAGRDGPFSRVDAPARGYRGAPVASCWPCPPAREWGLCPPVNAPLGPWSLAPVQATLWQMRLRRTLRRSRADHPVFAWAFGYALAAVVVGAGMLLIGPSPGVGWALVVFGGWLATLTSGPATRPQGEADAQHRRVGLSSVASTRARPPNPTRPRSTARGRSQPAFARSAPDCASGSRGASACLGVVALPGQAAISARRRRPHRRPPAALYRRQPEAPQRFLVADTDTANHPARCPLRRGSALMAGPTRLPDGTRARAGGGGRPVRPRAWRAVR